PAGWTYATALTTHKREGAHADFADTSLETLIDSPVLAGAHVIETPLGDFDGAPMSIAVGAETDTEARLTPEETGWLKNLVREEVALFGARHFDHYVFLLTLSDAVAHFGLEHHQSSDDRLGGRTLVEKDRASFDLGGLLAHESVHSWNGKYRRPAGLATGDYSTPMKGDLLWIYEGLTEYLGAVLTARSGSWTPEEARDDWAFIAEAMRNSRGRTWRPLADTAVEAPLLYSSRMDGFARRRAVDFYYEGQLLWLEVDTILREKSGGKVSMDDFTHAFHGGKSGPPAVVPYTLEDVIKTLNTLAPNDWKAFFDKRIGEVNDDAPLDGLTRAGWKLSYAAEPGPLFKSGEKVNERLDFRSSLGIVLAPEKMTVNDVVPGKPAERAGIGPGVHLIGVNGRKVSPERLEQAIADSVKSGKVELTYENADTLRTATLDYKDGLKYPRLVRIEGTPDVLSEILKAHAK
ncbi:MAG: M61 family metallopeptidase, partial [Deltaproteobacteria bacterium]|nr:M61 family metallopeptidase [Deltaproteobacteria bacterium]